MTRNFFASQKQDGNLFGMCLTLFVNSTIYEAVECITAIQITTRRLLGSFSRTEFMVRFIAVVSRVLIAFIVETIRRYTLEMLLVYGIRDFGLACVGKEDCLMLRSLERGFVTNMRMS